MIYLLICFVSSTTSVRCDQHAQYTAIDCPRPHADDRLYVAATCHGDAWLSSRPHRRRIASGHGHDDPRSARRVDDPISSGGHSATCHRPAMSAADPYPLCYSALTLLFGHLLMNILCDVARFNGLQRGIPPELATSPSEMGFALQANVSVFSLRLLCSPCF